MSLNKKPTVIGIIIIFIGSSLISAPTINSATNSWYKHFDEMVDSDHYDLLIIAYSRYAPELKPLLKHKNSLEVKTKLVMSYEIYNGKYFFPYGRDKQEKIKYFIKNAIEEWKIKYVLLVGDFRQLPVRYSHVETKYVTIPPEEGIIAPESRFISDLYYADIYDDNGNFCSWDSNENNIFGEWTENDEVKDVVDLKPDVYLGRLACRNKFEVKIAVNKIIRYEKNTYGKNWFKNMIVVGGDSFNDTTYGTDINEGEVITEKALEYMPEFNHIKFWISNGNLSTSRIWLVHFLRTINKGAGFIYFSGHCNPGAWTTHHHDDFDTWIPFFRNCHVAILNNKDRLPIIVAECCHPCQFNVTILDRYLYRTYKTLFPECWTWWMVRKLGGGAIAAIGGTGYSVTGIDEINDNEDPGCLNCIEAYDGWFNTHLFKLYNEEDIDVLGDLFGKTIEDYVNNFPVYTDRYHCKVVEMKVLLGDPSLKIGGYPS